jgi:hypothetical protein
VSDMSAAVNPSSGANPAAHVKNSRKIRSWLHGKIDKTLHINSRLRLKVTTPSRRRAKKPLPGSPGTHVRRTLQCTVGL